MTGDKRAKHVDVDKIEGAYAKKKERKRQRATVHMDTLAELMEAGRGMSNVAFNLSQDVELADGVDFKSLYQDWDKAYSAIRLQLRGGAE